MKRPLFIVIALGAAGLSLADTHYVSSTSTAGSPCTQASPCQPSRVWSRVSAGDTVIFLNGVYKGDGYMLEPRGSDALRGTASAPITIRAETDGGVLLDGEFQRRAAHIRHDDWLVIEGFNFCCGDSDVVRLSGDSDRNTFRRNVAWDAAMRPPAEGGTGQSHVWSITSNSDYNTFEDCAAFGTARKMFAAHRGGGGDSDSATPIGTVFRRIWARWEGSNSIMPKMGIAMFYHSRDTICENCLVTWDNGSMPDTYYTWNVDGNGLQIEDGPINGCEVQKSYGLISRDRNCSSSCGFASCACGTPNSQVYGSIVYLKHRPGAQPPYNCYARYNDVPRGLFHDVNQGTNPESDMHWENVVAFVDPANPAWDEVRAVQLGGDSGASDLDLRDATIISKANPDIGNEYNSVDVEHVESISDLGDSIFVGDGARICHRYENGEETAVPLWPWPMQDRIKAATTLASHPDYELQWVRCDGTNCVGEMVNDPHAVADVMADVVAMFGAIPAECVAGGGGSSNGPVPPPDEAWRVHQHQTGP